MAVLTAAVQRPVRLPPGGLDTARLPLAGYTNFAGGSVAHTVYHGSLVCCDVSDTDGYFRACPATGSTALTSSDIVGGVALETVSVTSSNTADGSRHVLVARNGIWGFPKNSVSQTDIGAAAYATDDGSTITTTSTDALWIGYIEEVDDTYVWVNIAPAFLRANSAT